MLALCGYQHVPPSPAFVSFGAALAACEPSLTRASPQDCVRQLPSPLDIHRREEMTSFPKAVGARKAHPKAARTNLVTQLQETCRPRFLRFARLLAVSKAVTNVP